MAQNSINLKVTNNADGFDVAGGTTARKLTATGADITLTGAGTNVYTFPASTCTLGSLARISGSSGAAGIDTTWQTLSSNSASQTSTTPATIMTTTGVGVGTWQFKYSLIFQTAATTTGIKIANNHTGTVTNYIMTSHFVTTGGTATTGVHDAIAAVALAGINEGFAERVINTSSKASVGVATANANQIIIVEGIVVISATGSLEFKLGTEVAASGVTAMAGSTLELLKIA